MTPVAPAGKGGSGLFLGVFALSCALFWWLPSILFRLAGIDDDLQSWALWVSFLGGSTFALGYLVPPVRFRSLFQSRVYDSCQLFGYRATVWLAFPALVLSVQFFVSRSGVEYGQGQALPFLYQVVFYSHMFFAFLFLGTARTLLQDRRRIIIVSMLVTVPRLVVSLHWGRFFLAQAVLPILFIALARGWVALSARRILQLCTLALFMVFVPALTRGDNLLGGDELIAFFQAGGTLHLLQDKRDLNLTGLCPPLLVSLTDKLVPYSLLGVCTMEYQGSKGVPATLDRILTNDDPSTVGTLEGTGSNYLLELYLTGGIGAIIIGSVLFGFTSRCFVEAISQRSLFAGIWAECLSRAIFAPRSTLGYVYERIPSLWFVTLMMIGLALFFYAPIRSPLQGSNKAPSSPLTAR